MQVTHPHFHWSHPGTQQNITGLTYQGEAKNTKVDSHKFKCEAKHYLN